MNGPSVDHATGLLDARVMLEIGWIPEAEREVTSVLDADPSNLGALNLFAKIKHLRGELSQAITCWAELHARSPHNETALLHLRALLQLAQDPERGAGEFLALSHDHLYRKPAKQIELESVFSLYHERRPDHARARCVELAARWRLTDRAMYKLVVLADAWIAELTGNLAAAAATLEALGRERGFEIDLDRLLGLARVYETTGTADALERAIRILRHIEQELERRGIEKLSVLGRLAALYARVGQADAAARYRALYVAGLRQRMQRPTQAEVATVAARRHLPLARLRVVGAPRDQLPEHASPRARAIIAAIDGRFEEARVLLDSQPLDLAYLADLADAAGEDALPHHLAAHEADPDDGLVLGWLLDRHAAAGAEPIADRLGRPAIAARARALLERAIETAPLDPTPWRRLATLHEILGAAADARACVDRATALAEAERHRLAPIGRVLAAGVYHFFGKAKGLIHEVWVHREPCESGKGGVLPADHVLGNLTDELKRGVRNTFTAVREYARARFPHRTADLADYVYSYKLPKEDEPSGGLSAGLPSALAFLSVFLQQSVPQDVASSGALITESHLALSVGPVGEVEYKAKAAFHRNLRMLILPRGNRTELERSLDAPPELIGDLVRYVASFDEAVRLVFGDDVFVS